MSWESPKATALLDKDTGNCTGIGFINYMSAEAAEKAHFQAPKDVCVSTEAAHLMLVDYRTRLRAPPRQPGWPNAGCSVRCADEGKPQVLRHMVRVQKVSVGEGRAGREGDQILVPRRIYLSI